MSSDLENEYFSDGITEEIINALAKINGLQVTSRTSSFFFKGKNIPISEIGKQLNVATLLEGSVRLSGSSIRITAQLIEAENDFHFWSETWDRERNNIFEIQDEISLIIADKLREQFGHFEIQEHLVKPQTKNLSTYDFSLKAKYLRNKWNPEDALRALALYEKALELDPEHSESYIGLADCYSFLGTTGFMPFAEAWGKTIEYTHKAAQLNNQLSGLYYQLSNIAFFIECDYAKALKEMQKAIAINPNNAEAQQFIAFLYILADQRKKSKEHLDLALGINPLSEETHFFRAYYHYMVKDYNKSLEMLNTCLDANPKNIPAISVKSLCLLKLAHYEEVISYFDKIPADVLIDGEKIGALSLAYTLKKDETKAKEYLQILHAKAKEANGFTADSYLPFLYTARGEIDLAFDWIAQAIEKKSSLLLLRFSDPLMEDLSTDSRYTAFKSSIYSCEEMEEAQEEKNALLDAATASKYAKNLASYLEESKAFLNPDLSLRSLAEALAIHPNQLSWLLNNKLGKNFNEYINHFRIESFKSIAKDPKNAHLTIEGLAYESGFNSKTVFNTYFKKETGLTPSQFLKA
ncbi:MAG: helix-turn-helix domain-containing protein [Bacteroidetes bacterium]|nr:helix-turn-helix domain-containing protein [Bacteroidota bacterium]